MSGQLTNYISPVINPLQYIQRQLTQQTGLYRDAQQWLRTQEQILVDMGYGVEVFVGLSASMFELSCDMYIALSEKEIQTLEQVFQATFTCIEEISQATLAAEAALINDAVIAEILARTTLESLLLDGGEAVMWVVNELVHLWATNGNFFGQSLERLISSSIHAIVTFEQMVSEVWNLLGDLPRILSRWATAINHAVSQYLNTLKSIIVPPTHTDTHPITDDLRKAEQGFYKNPNLESIYKIIGVSEGSQSPIQILNLGNNTILVTIAGLDLNHSDYINGIYNVVDMGAGDANDPYVLYTKMMIEEYIQKNHLQNPNVILAGHSAGGMVAQYIADQQGRTNFNVKAVITYGSPQVSSQVQGIQYDMFYNQNDPVPLLSWYESGKVVKAFQMDGLSPLAAVPASVGFLVGVNRTAGLNPVKQWIVNETQIPDSNNSPYIKDWIPKDHNYSGNTYLSNIHIQDVYKFDTSNFGNLANLPVQTISAPPAQNQPADFYRAYLTLQKDFSSLW